jgi:3',5'-cyclic AMP phosphodiesterase CpdA
LPDPQTITLLHVSDMQFGRNHRFGTLAAGDPEADFDALYTRLAEDLKRLTRTQALWPRVIIVSGDLAEWGLASEFKDAFEFLDRLATGLDIPRRNVVVVPGNHDVNRKLCESYFSECDGEEKEPVAPYARKWEPYRKHFDEFFAGEGVEFTVAHPWSMWHLDELRLVVAGLNSTMHESHRDEDHYGWVGERQLQWFEEQLEPYVERGWLRIGVVHHNVCRGAMDDDENLRDASDLHARLGSSVNLLLHGHTHEGKTAWLHRRLPVLSTGSAALNAGARPPEVPNQYQVIRIHPDRVERWARRYQPRTKSWAGDTDASGDGSTWHVVDDVRFDAVHATFGSVSAATPRPLAPSRDEKSDAHRVDDFTGRVAEICELRRGGEGRRVTVQRLRAESGHEYLSVYVADDQHVRSFPVAIAPSGITMELTQTFCETVFEPYYWSLDRSVACEIAYSGERAAEELIDWAGARNVVLRSFLELQGIIDFRGYVDRQTARLASDVV